MIAASVSAHGVVLAGHIVAVIAAYGAPLKYPVLMPYVRRHHPGALPEITPGS